MIFFFSSLCCQHSSIAFERLSHLKDETFSLNKYSKSSIFLTGVKPQPRSMHLAKIHSWSYTASILFYCSTGTDRLSCMVILIGHFMSVPTIYFYLAFQIKELGDKLESWPWAPGRKKSDMTGISWAESYHMHILLCKELPWTNSVLLLALLNKICFPCGIGHMKLFLHGSV